MSLLSTIVDLGKSAVKAISGNSVGSTLAKTAALGFALNAVNKSLNKQNTKPSAADSSRAARENRVQQSPNSQHSVPVVYGSAFVGSIVTDAVLANDNKTMFFVMTICEKTGRLFSNNQASAFSFLEVYWDGAKINFQSDGITVASIVDEDGVTSVDPAGLIKIYCYAGNSTTPVVPIGFVNNNLLPAYSIMPGWTTNHTMNDLVFAVVRVDYNAEKQITGLGEISFKIQNSMDLPGDVLYDYITSTRYGAGIEESEIYTQ